MNFIQKIICFFKKCNNNIYNDNKDAISDNDINHYGNKLDLKEVIKVFQNTKPTDNIKQNSDDEVYQFPIYLGLILIIFMT
jgi:hypothetical protein